MKSLYTYIILFFIPLTFLSQPQISSPREGIDLLNPIIFNENDTIKCYTDNNPGVNGYIFHLYTEQWGMFNAITPQITDTFVTLQYILSNADLDTGLHSGSAPNQIQVSSEDGTMSPPISDDVEFCFYPLDNSIAIPNCPDSADLSQNELDSLDQQINFIANDVNYDLIVFRLKHKGNYVSSIHQSLFSGGPNRSIYFDDFNTANFSVALGEQYILEYAHAIDAANPNNSKMSEWGQLFITTPAPPCTLLIDSFQTQFATPNLYNDGQATLFISGGSGTYDIQILETNDILAPSIDYFNQTAPFTAINLDTIAYDFLVFDASNVSCNTIEENVKINPEPWNCSNFSFNYTSVIDDSASSGIGSISVQALHPGDLSSPSPVNYLFRRSNVDQSTPITISPELSGPGFPDASFQNLTSGTYQIRVEYFNNNYTPKACKDTIEVTVGETSNTNIPFFTNGVPTPPFGDLSTTCSDTIDTLTQQTTINLLGHDSVSWIVTTTLGDTVYDFTGTQNSRALFDAFNSFPGTEYIVTIRGYQGGTANNSVNSCTLFTPSVESNQLPGPSVNQDFCSNTLDSLNQEITTEQPYGPVNPPANIILYFWHAQELGSTSDTVIPTFTTNFIKLSDYPTFFNEATTYEVFLHAVIDGDTTLTGDTCLITTPGTALLQGPSITTSFCSDTLDSLSQDITTIQPYQPIVPAPNSILYLWHVSELGQANDTVFETFSNNFFNVSDHSAYFSEGQTYEFTLRAIVDGDTSDFGDTCIISTPLNLITGPQISSLFCNDTLDSLNQDITTIQPYGPNGSTILYLWEVIQASDMSDTSFSTFSNNFFNMSDHASFFNENDSYTFSLKAIIDGDTTSNGTSCTIYTPQTSTFNCNLSITEGNHTPVSMQGASDGAIEINLSGANGNISVDTNGTTLLSAAFSVASNVLTISNISEGLYNVIVIDDSSCADTLLAIAIDTGCAPQPVNSSILDLTVCGSSSANNIMAVDSANKFIPFGNPVAGSTMHEFMFVNGTDTITSLSNDNTLQIDTVSGILPNTTYDVFVRAFVAPCSWAEFNLGLFCTITTTNFGSTPCNFSILSADTTYESSISASDATVTLAVSNTASASGFGILQNGMQAAAIVDQDSIFINALTAGNYEFIVIDTTANGVCADTINLEIAVDTSSGNSTPQNQNTGLIAALCNDTINSLSDIISAEVVAGADEYEWLFTDLNGNPTQASSAAPFLQLDTVQGISNGTTYQVRVRAHIGTNYGQYSDTCLLHIEASNSIATTGVIDSMCNIVLVNMGDYLYADPITGAEDYKWSITNTQTGTTQEYTRLIPSNDFQFTWLDSAETEVLYEVTVAVKINGEWGNFSDVCTITIAAPNSIDLKTISDAIMVYPNPSNDGMFNLDLTALKHKNILSIDIFDGLAKRVYTNHNLIVDKQIQTQLNSGIYSLIIQTSQGPIIKKLISH